MKNEYIRNENWKLFEDVCQELSGRESLIGPSMAAVMGPAGRGKSGAAKRYASQTEAVYIEPDLERSPVRMLRDICFELGKQKPGRMEGCIDMLKSETKKNRRLILIDEADLLQIRILELLRNVNEMTTAPILLIGEPALRGKLIERPRLSSRMRRQIELSPITAADVALYFQRNLGLNLNPDVVKTFHRGCGGEWRPVTAFAARAEKALASSGLKEIPQEMAENMTAQWLKEQGREK